MASIGIDAVGVGVATACITIFSLLLDIPAGLLADKWSRKGMLLLGSLSLAIAAIVLGSSQGLVQYVIGYLFLGINLVCTSGTYQAIIYDSLHEERRAAEYSKIFGRAHALFLAGAGVANIFSGFIAHHYSLRANFFITIISCALNAVVILTIKEPAFHKLENKEKILAKLGKVTKIIISIRLLKCLAIIMTLFAVVEIFKVDFGQLYMLRYVSSTQIIGILWAIYAFTWGLGSLIAHRLRTQLTPLILASSLPLILMAFIDHWISLILFMVQATAAAALFNQTETRIQEATPSAVRASVLSVLSTFGRLIAVPASFLFGWIFRDFGAFWAVRSAAVVATIVLIYWLFYGRKLPRADQQIAAETEVTTS
jgi:MFS family permease